MTRNEIMSSTPEQLASRYSSAVLESEMGYYAPADFDCYLGNARYTDLGGEIVTQETIDECEQMLVEWFDEDDKDRPDDVDAERLAIAYHLWAASCYASAREYES